MEAKATLSGFVVPVETVIWWNQFLREERQRSRQNGFFMQILYVRVPAGHRFGGVAQRVYDGYRNGLEGACADIVITARMPKNGTPVVLASRRAMDKPFGRQWWMQGGAVHSYRSLQEFIIERAEKECGVRPKIEGIIGIFRTCAEDKLCSTTQICFVGFAPYEELSHVCVDNDHKEWRLIRLDELLELERYDNFHWYPAVTFERALTTMPE